MGRPLDDEASYLKYVEEAHSKSRAIIDKAVADFDAAEAQAQAK